MVQPQKSLSRIETNIMLRAQSQKLKLAKAKRSTSIPIIALIIGVLVFSLLLQASRLNFVSYAQTFTVPCTITTTGDAWDGNLTFGLMQYGSNGMSILQSYLVNMRTDGQLLNLRQYNSPSGDYWEETYINQSTILFEGEAGLATHFWDLNTNQMVDFPGINNFHHDICYNPLNGHFLILKYDYRNVNGVNVLYDIIEEVDSTGGVVRTWYSADHIPISWASKFNEMTRANNNMYMDLTHCNAIMWDYQENVVYLNSRHLDTFFKINMTDGNIIWGCGKHGNFTLLDASGRVVSSLWYHSHATNGIGSGLFVMFDNDFNNETNPNDGHSRILIINVNETSMVAQEVWSWEAPLDYFSPFWGAANVLPNGDRIGTFGTPTKTYNSTIGAVIAEVNVQGQVVRTWIFPKNWGIYRVVVGGTVANASGIYEQPTAMPEITPSFVPEFASTLILAIATLTTTATAAFIKNYKRSRYPRQN